MRLRLLAAAAVATATASAYDYALTDPLTTTFQTSRWYQNGGVVPSTYGAQASGTGGGSLVLINDARFTGTADYETRGNLRITARSGTFVVMVRATQNALRSATGNAGSC